MKALICKQASKYTSLGKCYPITGQLDLTNIITADHGAKAYVNQHDNVSYNGGFNGIAKFDNIDVSKECWLAQPAMTKAEAQGISIIAALEMLQLNQSMIRRIRKALDTGSSLDFTNNFWVTVQSVLRQNDDGDRWLDIALRLADEFMNTPDTEVAEHEL